ncbi:MAG: LacI family DNA-binding transcriptional regulator [Hamadaea sp.]|uniref:LacI family DNA-binding transcriptional regulator n=1 Tax=Hamadaea sp. TaxID=2024425 RepID=UPI001833E40F|nr:LacI family DNA-binding transcriptional regulator [Hamadaea sp.]NUR69538.1 LacI family DNA-binding transcriptional regulator [Hamadaea sp.]NUT20774.1 LacI family DNA-binding transcriptional regulator [Hamadaea sp.]
MSKFKPTIEDVARAAGVSRATASRVINHAPGASAPLRARVEAAVAALGYRPDEHARALASGRTRAVDVVVSGCDSTKGWLGAHPYFGRVIAGMMPVLEEASTQLRLHAIGRDDTAEAIDEIAANASLGAVLADATPELAARFHRRCRRVVSLVPTAPMVPGMAADNTGGAYAAVRELHRLGCRRIAAIHGPAVNPCAIERRTGFRQAIRELGLAEVAADGDFDLQGGYRAAQQLLDRHPEIDGIFVACDYMAAGAIQAITAGGRRVPDDVSVIGFDDSIAAVCTNPPLTTMRLPVEEMAAAATRLLLEGIPASAHRQRFPVELVVRESTRG